MLVWAIKSSELLFIRSFSFLFLGQDPNPYSVLYYLCLYKYRSWVGRSKQASKLALALLQVLKHWSPKSNIIPWQAPKFVFTNPLQHLGFCFSLYFKISQFASSYRQVDHKANSSSLEADISQQTPLIKYITGQSILTTIISVPVRCNI